MVAAPLPPSSSLRPWVADVVRAHAPVVSLRDYQGEAIHRVVHAVGRDGKRRVMVVLPTGAGKTTVFGGLIHGWMADDMGRVLVLAHRDELIAQAVASLSMWVPRHLIGIVKAERDETDRPLVVASIQTLARPHRLARVGQFGLVVYDEAHHAASRSSREVLTELGVFRSDGPVLLGVTATPSRADGVRLDDVIEDIVYARTITEMQIDGWLVPIAGRAYRLLASSEKPRLGIDGDYSASWSEKMMLAANAPGKIVEAWQESAPGLKTLVFTPTVSIAKAVAESFSAIGVAAEWVAGEMAKNDRRGVIARFKSGETRVVANCAVWTEGFDEPSIECVVLGRPTKSQSAYLQMLGRGLRPFPGKAVCTVIDCVGVVGQMDLDAALDLGGKDVGSAHVPSEDQEMEASGEGVPYEVIDGRLVGTDLAIGRGERARWIDLGDDWWALRLIGTRGQSRSGAWMTVEPDGDGMWSVKRRGDDNSIEVVRTGLTDEWAYGIAQGIAKREGKLKQMGERARWLDRPISEGQLAWAGTRYGALPSWTGWELVIAEAKDKAGRWKRGRR